MMNIPFISRGIAIYLGFLFTVWGVPAATLSSILQPLNTLVQPEAIEVEHPASAPVEVDAHLSFLLSSDRLLSELESACAAYFGLQQEQLSLHLTQPFEAIKLQTTDWQIVAIQWPKKLEPQVAVSFFIEAAGQKKGPFLVTAHAQYHQPIYMAKDKIQATTRLDIDQFEIELVNTLAYAYPVVTADTDLSMYQLKRPIAAQQPLFWADVVKRPTIQKGALVHAVLQDGLLTLSMKAQAIQSGFVGDWITLKNAQTKKEFQGQIIDAHHVAVYF